jgi:hypothetical protein
MLWLAQEPVFFFPTEPYTHSNKADDYETDHWLAEGEL